MSGVAAVVDASRARALAMPPSERHAVAVAGRRVVCVASFALTALACASERGPAGDDDSVDALPVEEVGEVDGDGPVDVVDESAADTEASSDPTGPDGDAGDGSGDDGPRPASCDPGSPAGARVEAQSRRSWA